MRTFDLNEESAVPLPTVETSDTIYAAYSKHGKLLGRTTSLEKAKNWKDTAYVLRPDNTQAWPDNSQG